MEDVGHAGRKSSRFLSTFEASKVVGLRATQLRNNAEPMVDVGKDATPLEVAKRELREKKLQFTVRRFFPDGTHEDLPVGRLELNEK